MLTAAIWLAWGVLSWNTVAISALAEVAAERQINGRPDKARKAMLYPLALLAIAASLATYAVNR